MHPSVFYWRDCSRLGVVHFKVKRPIVCTMVSVCCYYASVSLPLKYELDTPIVAKLHTLCYCVNRIILILSPIWMDTLTCLMCSNVIKHAYVCVFQSNFQTSHKRNKHEMYSSGCCFLFCFVLVCFVFVLCHLCCSLLDKNQHSWLIQ